ncbi:MAG: tetratricopeptide repeat protein [Deltaproteobacteria bacterium]|jgi:tetratricopeptide (TPR) repeat protein|nr:tetratricopeptide repeat protein [Deltaproteobacteria bacterium]
MTEQTYFKDEMKEDFILSGDPEASGLLDGHDLHGALAALQKKHAVSEAAAGPYAPATLILLHDVGMCRLVLGDQAGAAECLAGALEGLEAVLGPDSPEALSVADALGETEASRGNFARSRELHAKALAGRERLFGPSSFKTVTSRINLALSCGALGLLEEEAELYRASHAASLETLGRIHPRTLKCRVRLGESLAASGNLRGAREELEGAWELHREALGPGSQGTFDAGDALAKVLTAMGDHGAACGVISAALAGAEEMYGELHPFTFMYRTHYGIALAAAGKLEEAEAELTKAVDGSVKVMGAAHTGTVNSIMNLLRVKRLRDGPGPVRGLYEELSRLLDEEVGPDSDVAVHAAGDLGKILAELGENERAAELFRRVISHSERTLGPAHEKTLLFLRYLRAVLVSMGDYLGESEVFMRVLNAVAARQGLVCQDPGEYGEGPDGGMDHGPSE